MPPGLIRYHVAAAMCLLIAGARVSGEESNSPPSIQRQLDELRARQDQLAKEVDQLKALLEQRLPRPEPASGPSTPKVVSANVHGETFRGTNLAKVAVIEYSDFGCSFCGKYARNIFPKLDAEYVQSGKVRYYFRDLPEPNETNSWFKARAARCAAEQGKFWEMHDLLFAAQQATGPDIVGLAQTLGLDQQQFNQCLARGQYLANIQRSAAGAQRMGLYGTPAFLIGTVSDDGDFVRVKQVLVGAETYDRIKSVLDDLLSTARQ